MIRVLAHSGHQQNIKALHLYSLRTEERLGDRPTVLVSDTQTVVLVSSGSNGFAYCTSQRLVTSKQCFYTSE